MHLLLEYTLADDYLDRRAALREEHLSLAREAHERGELLLAGALPDPYDRGSAGVDGAPRGRRAIRRRGPLRDERPGHQVVGAPVERRHRLTDGSASTNSGASLPPLGQLGHLLVGRSLRRTARPRRAAGAGSRRRRW